MAVDWEATFAGLVPVVVGIAIGFLLTPLAEMWSNRRKRKKLAAVLACEVEAIRAMAAHSISVNSQNVEDTRKTLDMAGPERGPLIFVPLDEPGQPQEGFESPPGEGEILGEGAGVKLAQLYRWGADDHHPKKAK